MPKRVIRKQDKPRTIAWFVALLDSFKDNKTYVLEWKEQRKQRSLNANAYAWVLIDRLAEKLKLTKEEVYRNAVSHMGGNGVLMELINESADRAIGIWESFGLGWSAKLLLKGEIKSQYWFTYGSSKFDTAQMSILIELLQQDCMALGIETKTPDEVAGMLSLWEQERTR